MDLRYRIRRRIGIILLGGDKAVEQLALKVYKRLDEIDPDSKDVLGDLFRLVDKVKDEKNR